MNPTNDERARFEEAMQGKPFAGDFAKRVDGEYVYCRTEFAWQTWLTARSQSAPAAQGEAVAPWGWAYKTRPGAMAIATEAAFRGRMGPRDDSNSFWAPAYPLYTTPQPSAPARNPHKELLRQALAAMTALHSSMQPTETHDGGVAPAAAVRAFVNEHARLLAAENLFAAATAQPSADDALAGYQLRQMKLSGAERYGKWRECGRADYEVVSETGTLVDGDGIRWPAEARKVYAAPPADARDAGNYNEGSVTVPVKELRELLDGNLAAAEEALPYAGGSIDFIESRGGDESDDPADRIAYHLFYTLHAAKKLRALIPEIPADRAMGDSNG